MIPVPASANTFQAPDMVERMFVSLMYRQACLCGHLVSLMTAVSLPKHSMSSAPIATYWTEHLAR